MTVKTVNGIVVKMKNRSYPGEEEKLMISPYPKWTWDEKTKIQKILLKKGYLVNTVPRLGCDRKSHDALLVQREDIPRLIEQLFRERIPVEVQAEGHGQASIIFVYDFSAETIIAAVKRFYKNNKGVLL